MNYLTPEAAITDILQKIGTLRPELETGTVLHLYVTVIRYGENGVSFNL